MTPQNTLIIAGLLWLFPSHLLLGQDVETDSAVVAYFKRHIDNQIGEPFDLQRLTSNKQVDFTSGGAPKTDKEQYCESEENGFFGRYHLIDRRYSKAERFGIIDVYKRDKMSNWKASDPDQKIWKIELNSNALSVWDSIHVGLTRQQVEEFGFKNNGFCVKKGDYYYSCDFNSFFVNFSMLNDTLRSIMVTRKCEKNGKN